MSAEPETLGAWFLKNLREVGTLIANSWLTFDRRTLGLTRILLGFYLLADLFRRGAAWEDMFSDKGILPNFLILERPQANHFSFLHGFTTAPELWVLFFVMLATFTALFVGYKTKVAQILSLLFITSMNGRVLLIENGGYVVQNLLLLWTVFLPLGDRFSVDGLLESMRRRRERTAEELNDRTEMIEPYRLKPYVTIVGLVICVQIFAVYYFNVVHKFGPGWKRDFSATYYVMYVDRMVTPIIAATRDYIPYRVQQGLTMSVIAAESGIGFCMMLPQLVIWGVDVKLQLKRFGLILINFLHIGFGSTFVLGPFAWGLCVFSSLFLSYEDWEITVRALKRRHRARIVVFDPGSPGALWFCRVAARLDRFGLLAFEEARTDLERAHGLCVATTPASSTEAASLTDYRSNLKAVKTPNERQLVSGYKAAADVIAALPIGPVFAWMVRVPLVSHLVDRCMRVTRDTKLGRFFGLAPEIPETGGRSNVWFVFRGSGRLMGDLVCTLFFVAAINQALVELWSTQRRWKEDVIPKVNKAMGWKLDPQEDSLRTLTHKFRFLQGWFMFSPNPVTVDGTVVVDAVTVDGRHINPLGYKAPDFDLIHAKSYAYDQIWSDYFNRIQGDGARAYQKPLLDYMRRLPERTGNPNDTLVSGEVYWVTDHNPRPPKPSDVWKVDGSKSAPWLGSLNGAERQSYGQDNKLLFTFGESGPPVFPRAR